ncbi:hypothetical protein [Streptomyces sp. NPDC051662]
MAGRFPARADALRQARPVGVDQLVVFFAFQRHFVQGVMAGSVK